MCYADSRIHFLTMSNNYTFLKITTVYPQYLAKYYSQYRNHLAQKSFQTQYDHLMADAFSWSNFYQIYLNKIGVNAFEIVANAELLQQTWAIENGVPFENEKQLVLAQIRAIAPDVVFLQDSFTFDQVFIGQMKAENPSIRLVIGWCAVNFSKKHLESFKSFDMMLSCTPYFVDVFRQYGLCSYQLDHAFENSLMPRLEATAQSQKADVLFAGSLLAGVGNHLSRLEIINQLAQANVSLELRLNLPKENQMRAMAVRALYDAYQIPTIRSIFKQIPRLKNIAYWENRPGLPLKTSHLKSYVKPPVFGFDYLSAIFNSTIGLNSHIDIAGEYAGNIRLFEITGTGACMVTDYKKNIRDYFEPDSEVVTYSSSEEAVEKIKWLLNHPRERAAIAKAGQARTFRNHSFQKRAATLKTIIDQALK